jgi:sortase (surface protein transpeptidase)
MDTPNNIWDVGWYNAGPVPGAPGDAVIDGHAGYPGQPLVFGRLAKIQPGEPIVVLLADGSKQVFTVISVQSWPASSMPQDLFEPYGPARLTLITCDGQFNSDNKTYASRLVVEAGYAGVGA